jgi:drug/metabolite transporter (DMT)-like permease
MTTKASPPREIRPVAAALYMLGACSFFAFNSIFVKLAADTGLHPFQIAFFRNFFALLIILPVVLSTSGPHVLIPKKPAMLALRGGLNGASMMAWFYAVPLMAITDLTAIGFTAPIWATLLAAIFLGEKMRLRRWSAIFIGICGALLVVRPGFQELNSAVFLVLFSSATWGATLIVIRRLTSLEHINTILVYQALMMAVIAFLPMLFVWQTPNLMGWLWMFVLGVLAMGAHSLHVRAFSMQEVSALQPIDFARFPIAAVGAFLILGEVLSPWTALGALIVFTSGAYISHREAKLRNENTVEGRAGGSSILAKSKP